MFSIPFPDLDSPEVKARIRESKLKKHEFLKPYMMDYWYPLVEDLTFPAKFFEIPLNDFVECFDGKMPDSVKELADEMDKEIKGQKVFIKTTNRSPKDFSYPEAPNASSGMGAIDCLAASMRILDDAVDLMDIAPLYAVIRPWISIPERYEFRCFVKDGELIGITQYFYDRVFDGLSDEKDEIQNKIKEFHTKLSDRYPVKDYVFDVFLNEEKHPILIEINPYGLSDTCLFQGYEDIENNGGFRAK